MGLRDLSLVSCLVWFTVRANATLTDKQVYLTSSMSGSELNERGLRCCVLCVKGKSVMVGCRGEYNTLCIGVTGL